MYYEEKVISGVLCWRGSPADEFTPFTSQELTKRIVDLRQSKKDDFDLWCADAARLREIENIAERQGRL